MKATLLIDGSNLGGAGGGARGARDPAVVVRWLLEWVRTGGRARSAITVVFDGVEPPEVARRYGPLEVVFAHPSSADQVILDRVREAPGRLTVVTDDRDLARSVRDLGAQVAGAGELLASGERAQRPASRGGAGSSGSVSGSDKPSASADAAYWRSVFAGGNPGSGSGKPPRR